MSSIQSSGFPLVFKVRPDLAPPGLPEPAAGRTEVLTQVRALEGMQKEAVVWLGPGHGWRMVSDEGPYLNGTDLAPFPLGFFAAGLQFSLMSRLVRAARGLGVLLRSLRVEQETCYTMEGSFLRGDAAGGAAPVQVLLHLESDAAPQAVAGLVRLGESGSAGHALMRDVLHNAFSLSLCGRDVALPGLRRPTRARPASHDPGLLHPDGDAGAAPEILAKVEAADAVHGVEGGAGSSLKAEQRRTLRVRGEAHLQDRLRMETTVRLFQPIGSSFRFACDESVARGGGGSAPPPEAYLAAGIGFCYMTQLGRYAHILKQPLDRYGIVQQNTFREEGLAATGSLTAVAGAFDTHVSIESALSEEQARDLVRMGEQTCFLHAAMRGSYPSIVRARLNGVKLD